MSLFSSNISKYDVRLVKTESRSNTFTLGEPFGPFKDFNDCLSKMGGDSEKNRKECGALQRDLEQKLKETLRRFKITESVNWETWVTPTPEDNLIESEVLHVTVSGNAVDYTKEELMPAVNTLIGTPVFFVPLEEVTKPDDLHHDPAKKQVGVVRLARFDANTIHALLEVEPEIKQMVSDGIIPRGSIEADFVIPGESTKSIADLKPEFISFSGYLLLPEAGTDTPTGKIAAAGDSMAINQVFEQGNKCLQNMGACCVKNMVKMKRQKSIFF